MTNEISEILFNPQSPFNIASDDIKQLILDQGRLVQKKKGERISFEGEPLNYIIAVKSGKVRVSKTDEHGRCLLIHRAVPGNWMGFSGHFCGAQWPHDLKADNNCELFYLPRMTFESVLESDPLIYRKILTLMSYYTNFFCDHLMDFVCKPLKSRVIQALLSLSERYQTLELELTQADLASFLGVTREAVAQQLSQLQKLGMVSSGYGKLIIVDKDVLKAHQQPDSEEFVING
ncbi:MAG: Crp/Fnr family transcriptional regulator [Oleispira sp.]